MAIPPPAESQSTHQPLPAVALTLDDSTVRRLAHAVALELAELTTAAGIKTTAPDGWLDAKAAAAYLGLSSTHPLHKLTARREIAFSQDTPRGKAWFRRADLDEYRLRSRIEPRRL